MVVRKAERLPVPKSALPEFTPVPRKQPRHDGWTPERQRAFIGFLADTGCVAIACRMVNMSQPSYYQLRRQPGAESFRAAADAAQTLGLQCAKDEAFDRAMNGELIPVFVAGKLMGFRRKKNDRLLMFILRHYGTDAAGRKTTINYFSTRATAGAAAQNPPLPGGEGRGEGSGVSASVAASEASTTTVKTVIKGSHQSTTLMGGISGNPASPAIDDTSAANLINAFDGVDLDAEAQAEIYRTLEACAERRRMLEAEPEHDPERIWIGEAETNGYLGQLESGVEGDWIEYKPDGEHHWESLGEGGDAAGIDEVLAGIEARKAAMTPEERAARQAAEDAMARDQYEKQNKPLPGCLGRGNRTLPAPEPDADDPRFDWRNWTGGTYTAPSNSVRPEPVEGHFSTSTAIQSAPGFPGEGDQVQHGGGGAASAAKPSKPRKPYKKRKPKPRFKEPDEEAYEARKAKAVKEVEAERRELAAAEGVRRKARTPTA